MINPKILLVTALISLFLIVGCTQQTTTPVPEPEPEPLVPIIEVQNQDCSEGIVLIDSLALDKPGFVVIHQVNADGSASAVVGHSALLSTEQRSATVPITEGKTDARLMAMLHYDNGDGQYTTLDEDAPVTVNNQIVLKTFINLGSSPITKSNGQLEVTVTNPDGNPVAEAVVELFVDNQKIATSTSDSTGKATFTGLPLGVEWYISAADPQNAFQAVSSEIEEPTATNTLSLQLLARTPEPGPSPEPTAVEVVLESDDDAFYQNGSVVSSLSFPAGSTINVTITQRTANSAFGGADIKSSAFSTFNVPNGQSATTSFVLNQNVLIESFWPSSAVKKSEVTFTPA